MIGAKRETLLGHLMRTMRRNRGVTMDMLASRAGYSKWTIHRIETGKTAKPHQETVSDIFEALSDFRKKETLQPEFCWD